MLIVLIDYVFIHPVIESGQSIVCIPHKLIVRIIGQRTENEAFGRYCIVEVDDEKDKKLTYLGCWFQALVLHYIEGFYSGIGAGC